MRSVFRYLLAILISGFSFVSLQAQCPARPDPGSVVKDALTLNSVNGVLNADFTMKYSVDSAGYSHYCYIYDTAKGEVEAPTLRLNQGDHLVLDVKDRIDSDNESGEMSGMDMSGSTVCGDTGTPTLNSTNVHFHGLNVPPICHQDDVLTTLIQPGKPAFHFDIQIPKDEPPGLYWYHPHVHGFTEFQVNGGAAGALIVEGMEKVRPEVAGLAERVFVIRQQYLVPWIPGPYQLTLNYQVAQAVGGSKPIIQMKPGEKQFWRVANATLQDFLPLQVQVDGKPQPLEVIALDGYPLAKTRKQDTILIPPAGRAEFIVQAPASGNTIILYTGSYSTGPTGNPDIQQTLAGIQLTNKTAASQMPGAPGSGNDELASSLAEQPVTATRKLFFSEEFGGTNGPIQFYITVDGQKQKV